MNEILFEHESASTEQSPQSKNKFGEHIASLGHRLRVAMGMEEISHENSDTVRPPTFKSYIQTLGRNPWKACSLEGDEIIVTDGYEFTQTEWEHRTQHYHPDLLDDGTFGAWLGLLPQPTSVWFDDRTGVTAAIISWEKTEPRVHRSKEMSRYSVKALECCVRACCHDWRFSRAEAYVSCWERMALVKNT